LHRCDLVGKLPLNAPDLTKEKKNMESAFANDPTGVLRAAHGSPLSAEELAARISDDESEQSFAASLELPSHWTEFARKRDQGTLLHDEDEDFAKRNALPQVLQPPHNTTAEVLKATIATPQVVQQRGAVPTDVLAPFRDLVKATQQQLAEPDHNEPLEKSAPAKLADADAAIERAVWQMEPLDGETGDAFFARCVQSVRANV
jgi:hypothetical protein